MTLSDSVPATSATTPESWVAIIDDDASLRIALARALRGHGINARTYGTAEEFVRRDSDAARPDCIVLDIHLGGLSGFDLQDLLIAQGQTSPIIFITAHDDMYAARARASGACGYLRKPFEMTALVSLLAPHLRSPLSF